MPTNESICNIEPNPQTFSQRYLHVLFQDGGREEKMVNLDFLLYFEIFFGDQWINNYSMFHRRLCDMDAEEFMMHGFDSDVCEDDDEPNRATENASQAVKDCTQQHAK